jgi:hypothetical protein
LPNPRLLHQSVEEVFLLRVDTELEHALDVVSGRDAIVMLPEPPALFA